MATLTETAEMARKTIKVLGLLIGVFLLLKTGVFVYENFIKTVKPPPKAAPTVEFGKLPSINFPEKLHPELTLRLETPNGGTPNLGDRATVFLMPTFRSHFGALDEASLTAKNMGFRNAPKEITERRFRWESSDFLPSTLEMDIINGSFSLQRNWQADPTILSDKQLPGKEQTVVEAKNFLRQADLMTDELSQARVEISYLTFSAGQYQEAVSLSEADLFRRIFIDQILKNSPVLPQDPAKGIIR